MLNVRIPFFKIVYFIFDYRNRVLNVYFFATLSEYFTIFCLCFYINSFFFKHTDGVKGFLMYPTTILVQCRVSSKYLFGTVLFDFEDILFFYLLLASFLKTNLKNMNGCLYFVFSFKIYC